MFYKVKAVKREREREKREKLMQSDMHKSKKYIDASSQTKGTIKTQKTKDKTIT